MNKKTTFSELSNFIQERHTAIILATLSFLVLIFLYLRVLPIQLETVPYTYDQGRDFLAARDIIINKNITLIGPTTGAEGVFHGAWWYYFLAVPFALTGGIPTAFYYFITFCALVQALLFYLVLKARTHPLIALVGVSILAIAPYFIRTSVFAISSIMTLPFILLLLYSLYQYLASQKLLYLGLIGLSMGMVFEGEVAFGLFLLPASVLSVTVAREGRFFFGSPKKIFAIAAGGVAATILRMVFELKNNFLQTRALLRFGDTAGTHDVGFKTAFFERVDLFRGYYADIFPNALDWLGWILLGIAIYGLYRGYKKFSSTEKRFLTLLIALIGSLFFMSLFYNKNYFWTNYLEGIQYMFLILVLCGLYGLYLSNKKLALNVIVLYLMVFAVTGIATVYGKIAHPEPVRNEGLRMHTQAVSYVHNQVGSKPYCLRMYTPPAITHTYNYLLDYHARTKGMTYPRTVYNKNECWYIIESDQNNERIDAWLKSNIPEGASKTHEHRISKDLVIQRWQSPPAPDSL